MSAVRLSSLAVASALLLGGCAGSSRHMTPTAAATGPAPGHALIVFMRPSKFAFAIDAPVFLMQEEGEAFLGISSASTRFDYQVAPGSYELMVSGEVAEFLDVTVAAGKTYYVIVEGRMGTWKSRFSLHPVRRGPPAKYHLGMPEFRSWLSEVQPVTIGPSAREWYEQHRAEIALKRAEFLLKLNDKTPAEMAELQLRVEDGE
jgi:hypothetical protein